MDRDGENPYYIEIMRDTGALLAQEQAAYLGEMAAAFTESAKLANEVEFWRWMGANYPQHFSSAEQIRQTAAEKAEWMRTQIQGKGYEWDYMTMQRSRLSKLMSVFDAGDCPTQPGIDITETGLWDGQVKERYQNKAYAGTNNPDLHNTPKDAVVVTNREKVDYARKQGYETEEYLDAETIRARREKRFEQAESGKIHPNYDWKQIASASLKAGVIGAVIGMTAETVASYQSWKAGELTPGQYLAEVLKAGGESGITAGLTSAVMIPIQAAVTAAGLSVWITVPVAFVFGTVINAVVAPCFGRGAYKRLLNEAKYYQALEDVYDEFIDVAKLACRQYESYIIQIGNQRQRYEELKAKNEEADQKLMRLLEQI